MLIGQPTGGAPLDTVLTMLLIIPAGIVAAVFTVVAALFGRGGVLRVIARKHAE
jgi:hypothetical protein